MTDSNPIEFHPYQIFDVPNSNIFIVGTFPIGKFTNPLRGGEIKTDDIDFFY